ncbi:TIGR02206 family membrane protein [Candidatus Gracilibacteria bacterium]|nr:TIGR02206 family membrane protein [Candidatus Gracilibacteria bacterium]
MEQFWRLSFDGAPLTLFGVSHVSALLAAVAVCLLVAIWARTNRHERRRERVRYALVAFCLLNQVLWDVWQISNGIWSLAYSLPLHICMLSVPLSALMLWMRSYRLFEVLYFWGFAGATQAMLTPDIGLYNFPHFAYWIFFTSHTAIWLGVIFMISAYRYRPTWGSILRVIIITNIAMLVASSVNYLTGGNYMYLARHLPRPRGSTCSAPGPITLSGWKCSASSRSCSCICHGRWWIGARLGTIALRTKN